MDTFKDNPFAELPQMLVEEMLHQSISIGDELYASFVEAQQQKEVLRAEMLKAGYIRKDADLVPPFLPTTCGVDGATAVEKLLSVDFIASAAVALEGLTPPAEKRYWDLPHHNLILRTDKHSSNSRIYSQSLMFIMEVELAVKAPHNVILLDGSLLTPMISVNLSCSRASRNGETELFTEITKKLDSFLAAYSTIIVSSRSDKYWAGLPKSTSYQELGRLFSWSGRYNDKALLTTLLEPGEFTKPVPSEATEQMGNTPFTSLHSMCPVDKQILQSLTDIHVFYYKPHSWNPAYRVEVSSGITRNDARLAVLLHGLKLQASIPGIMELYPLYIADRMVRHLGRALPALRQSATRRIAEQYDGEISDILFNMHSYRSD